jgi:hypothetical protein
MIRGRPPKKAEDRHTSDIKIPLTEADKVAIWEAAEVAKEKPVTWARNVLLKAAKRLKRR